MSLLEKLDMPWEDAVIWGASALTALGAGVYDGYCTSKGIETRAREISIGMGLCYGILCGTAGAICGACIDKQENIFGRTVLKKKNLKTKITDGLGGGATAGGIAISFVAGFHLTGTMIGYAAGRAV